MSKKVDLTDCKFGLLVAIEPTDERKNGKIVWKCMCDCGNIVLVPVDRLKAGYTKSCGCARFGPRIDLAGKRFGNLVVVEVSSKRIGRKIVWKCKCDCGNDHLVTAQNLRNGNVRSCRCLRAAVTSERRRKNIAKQKFGNLIALEPTDKRDMSGCIVWNCLCACGSFSLVSINLLRCGGVKSCGCLKHRTGPDNPLWNSSLSHEERVVGRDYPEYRKWSKSILLRDDYICKKCGNLGGSLAAHHIVPYKFAENLRTEINNGITLCNNCHKEFHKIFGKKIGIEDEFPYWLADLNQQGDQKDASQ